jgi:hypothetical protein
MDMASYELRTCAVCAWRETCQKRFKGGDSIAFNCPEFTRDVRIKDETIEKEDKGRDKKPSK